MARLWALPKNFRRKFLGCPVVSGPFLQFIHSGRGSPIASGSFR